MIFSLKDGKHFYQWDRDRVLVVDNEEVTQVHFTNDTVTRAIVKDVYIADGVRVVDVPTVLLQCPCNLTAYAYITEGEDREYTLLHETFRILARKRPDNYIPPDEHDKWEDVRKEILEALEQAQTAASDAATSEQNAATSEQNAAASEEAAEKTKEEVSAMLEQARQAATAADASAAAAKTSETNADASEAAAKESENNAKISEQNALKSENEASSYKDIAEQAATNAANSATEAKGSETSAAGSATAASNSAREAKTAEINASGSASTAALKATAAANSETKAEAAATEAKKSENNAVSSASAATLKADAAATSATAAANSAAGAKTSEQNAAASESIATNKALEAENSASVAKTSEMIVVNLADTATAKAAEAAASASEAKISETNAANSEVAAKAAQKAAEAARDEAADIAGGDFASNSALNAHIENTTAHITAEERTAWNNKSDSNHNHEGVYAPKEHNHSQYLTQHQDISGKADKTYVESQDTLTLNSAKSYTDTKITALVGGTSVAEQISEAIEAIPKVESVQPDWNQSDETAADYIKNKTHWIEPNATVNILPEQTVVIGEDGYTQLNDTTEDLQEGKTYTVVFNGVTYECVAWVGDENAIFIGNGDIYGGEGKGGDEPFSCDNYVGGETYLNVTKPETYTISIFYVGNAYHKIDTKFLPPMIGKKGQSSLSEIFNDYSGNTASGYCSHAEGGATVASGDNSHAEGAYATASGNYSHAEGYGATASGFTSHAEGGSTVASGDNSHAEGYYTIASGEYQHVQGKYNIEDTSNVYAHIVGNGRKRSERSNAHTLDWSGNAWYSGTVEGTGFILKAPDGTRYKITVANNGTLAAAKV